MDILQVNGILANTTNTSLYPMVSTSTLGYLAVATWVLQEVFLEGRKEGARLCKYAHKEFRLARAIIQHSICILITQFHLL